MMVVIIVNLMIAGIIIKACSRALASTQAFSKNQAGDDPEAPRKFTR
jgi:hypothetical protein